MSMIDQDGESVGQSVDRAAMAVRSVLAKLSIKQRRAFMINLFDRAGVRTKDIAATLRCSEPTIRRDKQEPIPDIAQVLARH